MRLGDARPPPLQLFSGENMTESETAGLIFDQNQEIERLQIEVNTLKRKVEYLETLATTSGLKIDYVATF